MTPFLKLNSNNHYIDGNEFNFSINSKQQKQVMAYMFILEERRFYKLHVRVVVEILMF